MRRPAHQPGQVLDRGVVAVHRVGRCPCPCRRAGGGRSASPAAPARPASSRGRRDHRRRHGPRTAATRPTSPPMSVCARRCRPPRAVRRPSGTSKAACRTDGGWPRSRRSAAAHLRRGRMRTRQSRPAPTDLPGAPGRPRSTPSASASENVTVYSSPLFDDGVLVTCTPSAFGDTTTTALSAVTTIQSACSA